MTKIDKPMVRAWRLPHGQTLHVFAGETVMPRADVTASAGSGRPREVCDLLTLADDDA